MSNKDKLKGKRVRQTFDEYYDSLDWVDDLKHLNLKQAMRQGAEWARANPRSKIWE